MTKEQLASKIWEAANKMRGKIDAVEYKYFILGFMFYKFLSEKTIETFDKIYTGGIENFKNEDQDESIIEEIRNTIGYFIPYKHLFSTWFLEINQLTDAHIIDAITSFNNSIKKNSIGESIYTNIFKTLSNGIEKLGSDKFSRNEVIKELVEIMNLIPSNKKDNYDILGFIYEYLISNFASQAGKKAGEFYTPYEISFLMSEIIANHLKEREKIVIYDPTSGSGSLLLNIAKSIKKYLTNEDKISYYAQELNEDTYNLTRMNLIMRVRNVSDINVRNADTLKKDWPIGEGRIFYADAVVSNPPYSISWDGTADPRYDEFGIAPTSKADYAFLLHDLYHVDQKGIMTIVLPHGVLFRGGKEKNIRMNLIEKGYIDSIISLPPNIFFGTGIPTVIIVLKKSRINNDKSILFIDASKNFIKDGRKNKLQISDIRRISDAVINRTEKEKFSKIISIEEIRNNDYNLNISRYVSSADNKEEYNLYSLMFGGLPKEEIDKLGEYWSVLPRLRKELFIEKNDKILDLNIQNMEEYILNHDDVKKMTVNFTNKFFEFKKYLKKQLIERMTEFNIEKKEEILAKKLFSILDDEKLIDKYDIYQIFSEKWNQISNDIEIIQEEGIESAKEIIPNIIANGKAEKQDGFKGKLFSFELIEETMLMVEVESIKTDKKKLNSIKIQKNEMIELLDEEEKEKILEAKIDYETTDKKKIEKDKPTKINTKKLNARALELKNDKSEQELYLVLVKIIDLENDEKNLENIIKNKNKKLKNSAKECIEKLTMEQIKMLLEKKWIVPIIDEIFEMPNKKIDELILILNKIMKKYEITLETLNNEIYETQDELRGLLDQLEGDELDMKGIHMLRNNLN